MGGVLLISPDRWTDHFVSKHHYAITLAARGMIVLFLNPPDLTRKDLHIEKAERQNNLYIVSAPCVARGLRFYPKWLRQKLERRWLKKLENISGFSITTIWLFENSRFFDMNFAENRLKIYHQVDLSENFHLRSAATSADVCFCTTGFIKNRLLPCNPRTYKIHHGVSTSENKATLSVGQMRRFTLKKTNVAYIGNLNLAYLNVKLLSDLPRHFLDVCFHFVGQYQKGGKLYCSNIESSNIVWWGKVDSSIIPEIINRCDVLIVAYRADKYREQLASPHKIMEYLASGKTVVSTYTDEYKNKRHLIEMVDEVGDFKRTFEKVIEGLSYYNSPEKKVLRIEYAQNHSYDKQLDKIIALLKKHGLNLGQ